MSDIELVPLDTPADMPPADPDDGLHDYELSFSGSGAEYFRIWMVNLALTVATLGIYSAWAKVRRMQYFYRNTHLAGAAFDFHGRPGVILRGRLIAAAIAVAYHYAFGFSVTVGLAVIAAILLALPYLMMNALRFRLRNTSYRGLRFGFTGSAGSAYRAYVAPVAIFVFPAVLAGIPQTAAVAYLGVLPYLGWPMAYAAMKRYQHQHLGYGQRASYYTAKTRQFVGVYLRALGWTAAAVVAGSVTVTVLSFVISGAGVTVLDWLLVVASILVIYVVYLVSGPYVTVHVANIVWNNTACAGIGFESRLSASGLIKLQTRNVILTLLTLGLYRPFAVVNVYRYRLAHMTVRSADPIAEVLSGARASAPGAAGDGAADMLGFDLSW